MQVGLNGVGDLLGELLLHLQALGVHVDHARELAQADDAAVRDVRDVRLADEGHHVVLAVAVELDVAHQHELVVAFDLLEGLREIVPGVELVAGKVLGVRSNDARGRIEQPFALRVFADEAQDASDVSLRGGDVRSCFGPSVPPDPCARRQVSFACSRRMPERACLSMSSERHSGTSASAHTRA